jgi:hypothetical protein
MTYPILHQRLVSVVSGEAGCVSTQGALALLPLRETPVQDLERHGQRQRRHS